LADLTEAEAAAHGQDAALPGGHDGLQRHPVDPAADAAYGLTDFPVGQLAWIVEKFKEWTDPSAELPEDAVDRDHLPTNVSIYWFTGTAGSSASHYCEVAHDPTLWEPRERGTVPTGVAVLP
jgi:hypothetical protein